jgi:hypothetical protein
VSSSRGAQSASHHSSWVFLWLVKEPLLAICFAVVFHLLVVLLRCTPPPKNAWGDVAFRALGAGHLRACSCLTTVVDPICHHKRRGATSSQIHWHHKP